MLDQFSVRSIRVFMLTGFSVKTTKIKKKAKRQKVTKYKEDSEEDDTEWIPG